jgi:hypothetical protein
VAELKQEAKRRRLAGLPPPLAAGSLVGAVARIERELGLDRKRRRAKS